VIFFYLQTQCAPFAPYEAYGGVKAQSISLVPFQQVVGVILAELEIQDFGKVFIPRGVHFQPERVFVILGLYLFSRCR